MYSQAVRQGLTNRALYLEPLTDWGIALAQALAAAVAQVLAATTADQVAAVALTIPAPPAAGWPTIAGAMAITS